jgi:hypothetical protein
MKMRKEDNFIKMEIKRDKVKEGVKIIDSNLDNFQ